MRRRSSLLFAYISTGRASTALVVKVTAPDESAGCRAMKSAGKPSGDKKADDSKPDTNKLSSIFGKNSKKKENADWTCSASLVFEDGKLVRVNFAHKDVHSPYDWQAEKDPVRQEEKRKEGVPTCEFSLPKCPR